MSRLQNFRVLVRSTKNIIVLLSRPKQYFSWGPPEYTGVTEMPKMCKKFSERPLNNNYFSKMPLKYIIVLSEGSPKYNGFSDGS